MTLQVGKNMLNWITVKLERKAFSEVWFGPHDFNFVTNKPININGIQLVDLIILLFPVKFPCKNNKDITSQIFQCKDNIFHTGKL